MGLEKFFYVQGMSKSEWTSKVFRPSQKQKKTTALLVASSVRLHL